MKISVNVDAGTFQRLAKMAAGRGVSIASLVSEIVEDHVRKQEAARRIEETRRVLGAPPPATFHAGTGRP